MSRKSFLIRDILFHDQKLSHLSESSQKVIDNHRKRQSSESDDTIQDTTASHAIGRKLLCPSFISGGSQAFSCTCFNSDCSCGGTSVSSALNSLIRMTNYRIRKMNNEDGDINFFDRSLSAFEKKHNGLQNKRKIRTIFTNEQTVELETRFTRQHYITATDRNEIATLLGLSNSQVITWFQNRRAKLKKEHEEQRHRYPAASFSDEKDASGDDTARNHDLVDLTELATELPGGVLHADIMSTSSDCHVTNPLQVG